MCCNSSYAVGGNTGELGLPWRYKPPQQGMSWGQSFLTKIVWLSKAYRLALNLSKFGGFFIPFFPVFFRFFLSGHWKTSNLVEEAIDITIQWKYEIVQHYWLSLCFTLNITESISCFHLLLCRVQQIAYASTYVHLVKQVIHTIFFQHTLTYVRESSIA